MTWLAIRSFFKLVPPWALAGALALVGLVIWGLHREHAADAAGYVRGYGVGHAEFTTLQTEMTRRALVAAEDARAEEMRRAKAQKEIEDANEARLQTLRADAAVADAAAGRLRQRVADLIAAARRGAGASDPAPVVGSPAAGDPVGVFANVLSRCVERVRFLAAVADERGAAGAACVSEYDALTPPENEQAKDKK